MAVVGAALVLVTSSQMREQSVRDGTGLAVTVAAYAAGVTPAGAYVTGVLPEQDQAAVAAATAGFGSELVELRLWSTDGRLMYSSRDAGTGLAHTQRFEEVFRSRAPHAVVQSDVREGGAATDPTEATQRGTVLDVYVPVLPSGTAAGGALPAGTATDGTADLPVGVAEVMLDHTRTQQTLTDTVRTVALVVAGSLVVLWLLLFQIVHSTSRRLRTAALENARLAMLDSLTGLPNRRLLTEQMQRAVRDAREDHSRVGLILLDIDRFKDINDTLGHDHGDALLELVAARLRNALRDDDVVARLGGDEFAILLPDVRSVANAERLAQRVRGLFSAPFELGDLALHVDTSVGVACLPDHAEDPSSLMRTADIAMYAAKHQRSGVAVYSPGADDSSPARLVLMGELHAALEEHEAARAREGAGRGADGGPGASQLEMHYQPKIELASERTVGLEALMRWHHPTRGLVGPGTFVPLAEQSGLIHRLTTFALDAAVRQLAQWSADGTAVPVAVNLSAHDVADPEVVDTIEELLARHGVRPDLLEVEITETALVADRSRVVPVLERLGALGVRVAIDDFGTGTTSISQLRDLPVAELKIDRVFVADLGDGEREGSELVVQAMVDLAHSFGLRVVAEGVEDEVTARTLQRLGVDQAQGYLWARPGPAHEVHPPGGAARGDHPVLHPIG
ncbi:EAL domain-containing protein [Cellulomonas shaoxiangyii]|uniref:EAL domain-containing protein n=2 Tax=Cellulomonas shaoxiangyii TaxID=2566013 RepID=A0A4P7SNN2_9CELL|nr:EAL domain-containing protein [Cellulomonas shaoxiangyii]TGY84104.1 EAL domain-containing protein [Cellulomonas shaoxiangyii]